MGFARPRDPYIIDDLLQLPSTVENLSSDGVWESLRGKEITQHTPDLSFAPKNVLLPPLELGFFRLEEQTRSLSSLESSDTSSVLATAFDERPSFSDGVNEDCNDIWALLPDDQEICQKRQLTSWDPFLDPTLKAIKSPYLSEQSIYDIDAVLHQPHQPRTIAPVFVRSQFFLSALSQLGLGRTSSLFPVDEVTGQSKYSLMQAGQSGFSHGLVEQVIRDFQNCGYQWWALRSFLKQNFATSPHATILMAFARALTTVLQGLEKRLQECFLRSKSILQLHQYYQLSVSLLNSLTRMLNRVNATKKDGDLLFDLAEEATSSKFGDRRTSQVVHEILRFCSRPLLLKISIDAGLRSPHDPLQKHVSQLDLTRYESVLSPDLVKMIEASQEALGVLKRHQAHHPILNPLLNGQEPFDLTWEMTFEGLENQRKRAQEYEQVLKTHAQRYSRAEHMIEILPGHMGNRTTDDLMLSHAVRESLTSLDWKAEDTETTGIMPSPETDNLSMLASSAIVANVDNERGLGLFEPQILMALESSLHPILSVQSVAVNSACLRLIFYESKLRSQIHLQWRCQFLMDARLRSRLSEVLFDTRRKYSFPLPNDETLPSDFSFGIEDAPDDQSGAGSIEILDLLRLHYQPPQALRYIFTDQSLECYHHIFKGILRVLRLQHLTQSLVWQLAHKSADRHIAGGRRRFRLETYRFMCALNDYIGTYAIGITFKHFEDHLREIEVLIGKGSAKSLRIQDVQEMHESTLRQIKANIFLGNDHEQRQIQKALSKAYRMILKQEPVLSKWKQQVAKLISLLRESKMENSQHLALKLDPNGYYG